jgi:hypothetical protein
MLRPESARLRCGKTERLTDTFSLSQENQARTMEADEKRQGYPGIPDDELLEIVKRIQSASR